MRCPNCGFEFEKEPKIMGQPAPKQESDPKIIKQSAFEKMNGKEATNFIESGGRVEG